MPRLVRAGPRDHLVTLENPAAPVVDGDGGYTEAWASLSPPQMWMSIENATQRSLERLVANTVQAQASHVLKGRYHGGVTTETRITSGTRVFSVTGVQNVNEGDVELVLLCQEVVA